MKLYKLTDAEGYTRRRRSGETLWVPGEEVQVEWGNSLCDKGCLHAYASPLVAVFMDPFHVHLLPGGKLWEAEGEVRRDDGVKVGTDKLTIIREITIPELSKDVRIRAAIYCAQLWNTTPAWSEWAAQARAASASARAVAEVWARVAAEVWAAAWVARVAAEVWAVVGKDFDLDAIIAKALEDE